MKRLDLIGQKYGKLLVVEEFSKPDKKYIRYFICICDCGEQVSTNLGNLRSGHTKSCGCLSSLITGKIPKKHGFYGTPEYISYMSMLSRIRQKRDVYRDVAICDRWNPDKGGSIYNFLEDMGKRPEGMTLNRINGAKVYCKENCEWATYSTQGYDQKKRSTNKSGKTGVHWNTAREKWVASICVDNKRKGLGYFNSFEDAVNAREAAELKYFGWSKE